MTKEHSPLPLLDLLELTLDTFGADRTRWPAQRRHELSHFIASNAEARRLMAQAAMFDRLLDEAPTVDTSRHAAILSGIMEKIEHTPRMVIENTIAARKQSLPVWRRWGGAGAGAALAASLMLGVIAGQNAAISGVADEMAAITGLASSPPVQQVALTDDSGSDFDEDLL
jgi:hypothetical protein